METKTEKAIRLYSNGLIVEAMRIFKTFKIGFSRSEIRTLEIAYESKTGNSSFYESIGIDTDAVWNDANSLIRSKYNINN